MQVSGVGLGFIEPEAGFAEEFNRWYDLDHLPENIALPGVAAGRRYVATSACKAARSGDMEALADGQGTFCTTYLFGPDLPSARADMTPLAKRLAKEGRMYRNAKTRFFSTFNVVKTYAAIGVPSGSEALPHLGHTGIYVGIIKVDGVDNKAKVLDWYDEIHVSDVLEVPGMLACLRLEPMSPAEEGWVVLLYLLEGDAAQVAARVSARAPQWREQGRLDRPAEVELITVAPFQFIPPLQYDLLKQ